MLATKIDTIRGVYSLVIWSLHIQWFIKWNTWITIINNKACRPGKDDWFRGSILICIEHVLTYRYQTPVLHPANSEVRQRHHIQLGKREHPAQVILEKLNALRGNKSRVVTSRGVTSPHVVWRHQTISAAWVSKTWSRRTRIHGDQLLRPLLAS